MENPKILQQLTTITVVANLQKKVFLLPIRYNYPFIPLDYVASLQKGTTSNIILIRDGKIHFFFQIHSFEIQSSQSSLN